MTTQQIIFKVGNGEYGMDVSQVNAIESLNNVVAVPNAANHILGIINLRGEVLPVYSLRTKFGMEEEPVGAATKIIVTRSNGVAIAFKVDEVKEIAELNDAQLSPFPDMARSAETAYADRVAHLENRLILLINQNALLHEEESAAISEFVSKAAENR